jgi:rSAM/selenodomain-associated transferase 2
LATITVAAIIPTLNEESSLRCCLTAILSSADEVVVSDGGSRDGTVRLAEELGARIVCGPPGRGPQLNRGAAASDSEVLLFLHADTWLPEAALPAIRKAMAAGKIGGGFQVRFDGDHTLMSLGSRLVQLRTRLTRSPLGDQAQFVGRATFTQMGGFRDWPILEDLDFIRRLKRRGDVVVLPLQAVTSSRRYLEDGIGRTVAINWLIWALYFAGVPAQRLARLYRPRRSSGARPGPAERRKT